MGNLIPKAVEPHFNSIVSKANEHPWLVQFYHDNIRNVIHQTIEDELFESDLFAQTYPERSLLDRLSCLKGFFDPKVRRHEIYLPLKQVFKDISATQKKLQDTWFKAMVSRKDAINLNEGLPSYTYEVLREIMTREILLYMKRKANESRGKIDRNRLIEINYWLKKELQHLGPVSRPMALDIERFEKIHDPSHQELDFGNLLGNAWYFINGVNRTPLFLQCELITIKSMFSSLKNITYALSHGGDNFKRTLFLGLPFAAFKFMLGVFYLMFAPYRLARTMVNELTGLFKLGLQTFSQKMGYQTPSNIMKALSIALEWGCYLSLLWVFGLPILPNPFAWMPVLPPQSLLLGVTAFILAATGAAWTLALTNYVYHNPIVFIQQSVETVERQVEKGLQAVDLAHKKIFKSESKGFTPQFNRSRMVEASSQDHSESSPTPAFRLFTQ